MANILDRILGRETAEMRAARADIQYKAERLKESFGQLQLALEDRGWEKLAMDAHAQFSREGLRKAAELSRIMFIANPLIKRGLNVRAAYVHGQDVGITARADGKESTQDVNAVVQAFLDDDSNRSNLTGSQARIRLENALGTDGNVFITLFTDPMNGRVQARTLPFDEIADKISKAGDRGTTHYYLRKWTEDTVEKAELYPDIRYRPQIRSRSVKIDEETLPVNWDSPVYHLHDNGLDGWKFGIGDAYASLPWARAYKEFLEDWALLIKALSKIAFVASKDTKTPASQQSRNSLANLANAPAGSTAEMNGSQKLEAMPKSGATIDSESGRPLLSILAAGMGLPVTTLSADPGQTGARAVAETLNQPTRLEFELRQKLWSEMYRAVLGYVIDQAVIAPRGPLKGTVAREDDRMVVTLRGGDDRTLDIVWPDLNEIPIETLMEAISKANELGVIPPLVLLEQALRALGIRDVDEIIDSVKDDEGNFIDPEREFGQRAVNLYRNGQLSGDPLNSEDDA
ncbi:hypothetical protein [Glutamicibacter sp. FBE19]|uniref:hypothetical protein n=1 Tax=Glutamicibacter sp. FBE19 TaxID=2761534 RepID=UPI0018966914|nr:hypothetical protein [Glutamicibacter sp. FBE19]MBF6671587.1 hypothetical protein [Glutamicibacter sp. FBE19]